jgi:hypothetical protein
MPPVRTATAALALAIAGCGAPTQRDALVIAPGADGRLEIAMRYGYGGLKDVPRPAEARRILAADQLVEGPGATGRLGDWTLENGFVVAVVTAADGSSRGGKLVDLVRRGERLDELGRFELSVLGRPVVYESLGSGFDRTTGAAYIHVAGHPRGLPHVSVTTRYDLGMGLDAVLVHTHVRNTKPHASGEAPASLTLSDAIEVAGESAGVTVAKSARHFAWLGARVGYLYRSHGETSFELGEVPNGARASFELPLEPNGAGVTEVLHARMITPLQRPDSAAVAVALARIEGRAVGDVEVRLAGGRDALLSSEEGDLSFEGADGDVLWARGIRPAGVPRAYVVSLPVGSYGAAFHGAALASRRASTVVVSRKRLSTIHVRVAGR